MSKKKIRKAQIKKIVTKKGRVVSKIEMAQSEEITYSGIRYRDVKGRFSKFTTKKKLRAIMLYSKVERSVKTGQLRTVTKESILQRSRMRKWKRRQSDEEMKRRWERSMRLRKKSVVIKIQNGLTKVTYVKPKAGRR